MRSIPSVRSVIDPFAGSGTTGVIAYRLGIKCILIEKDEGNCQMIKERMVKVVEEEKTKKEMKNEKQ